MLHGCSRFGGGCGRYSHIRINTPEMTTATSIRPPSMYVCLISSIHPTVEHRALFTEIGKVLGWDGEQTQVAINHAQNHVHTKLFLAPKDLAETRAGVLAARLQHWLASSKPAGSNPFLNPTNNAFRIGVHKHE